VNLTILNSELDARLLQVMKRFWLKHWIGAWMAGHVAEQGWCVVEKVKAWNVASGWFYVNDVMHGFIWHYMATLSFDALNTSSLTVLGRTFCSRSMKYYSDCYHGIGHGILHSFVITFRKPEYSVVKQLLHLELKGDEYDTVVEKCNAFPFVLASGCVDGATHSIFNYMEEFPPEIGFCALRLWAPLCYRNLFQYAPLRYFGVQKAGRTTQIEWFMMARAHAKELLPVPSQIANKCLLDSRITPSCLFGIMFSAWGIWLAPDVDQKVAFCNRFVGDALDVCLYGFRSDTVCKRYSQSGYCPNVSQVGAKGILYFLCKTPSCPSQWTQ